MTTILDTIVAQKKKELSYITNLNKESEFDSRSFYHALTNPTRDLAIIAEVKKASPSKGILVENFDPLAIAKSYETLQMDAVSVLTDEKFFQGKKEYLTQIKKHTTLPVLRKDFIIDEKQIHESKAIGADAILLIAAILDSSQLREYMQLAEELQLDVLVEVHDEMEIEKVLSSTNPKIIGVNNRDLKTFETKIETSQRLRKYIPEDILFISESGIHTREDVDFLRNNNVHGLLVGEAFMIEEKKDRVISSWFQEALT
ncbi:indole-3-glycerol phosphate synthase TrpC [Evansella sp. AB-rgal1]|uniref:indole-3-glycerol phosphate synthase TrpC n=1 Tax=Evansella sp. AB-rgal1 TaxID=3242696 RepID=UPI00359DE1AD